MPDMRTSIIRTVKKTEMTCAELRKDVVRAYSLSSLQVRFAFQLEFIFSVDSDGGFKLAASSFCYRIADCDDMDGLLDMFPDFLHSQLCSLRGKFFCRMRTKILKQIPARKLQRWTSRPT
jgi:hypothetical protein